MPGVGTSEAVRLQEWHVTFHLLWGMPPYSGRVDFFTLSQGANKIQLVILDNSGQVRDLDYSTSVSSELLDLGVHEYGYGSGFLPSGDISIFDCKILHNAGAAAIAAAQNSTAVAIIHTPVLNFIKLSSTYTSEPDCRRFLSNNALGSSAEIKQPPMST